MKANTNTLNPEKKLEYSLLRLQFKLAPAYFLAPALIFFIIFVVWPILQSLFISFHEWNGFGEMTFLGFENYTRLLGDSDFRISILNNVRWLVLSMLAPIAGLCLALFLNQSVRGIRMAKSLFFFPFVINLVVIGLIFTWFYNPDLGLLAHMFRAVGLEPIPIIADENLATYGIIFAGLWPQTAYCMILYLTGLSSVQKGLVDAGRIDGAKGWSMFRHVIFPQLQGANFIAIMVTMIGALRSFDLIAIMTAGGPYGRTNVLAYFMYEEALFNYNVGYGSAIAVILFLIMSVFIAIYLRTILKNEK